MILFNVIYVLAALFNLELNEFYMLRGISFCLISCFLILNINAQQFGVLTDSRDGRVYKTVKIGEQEWMAENLNVSQFRNGDSINNVVDENKWRKTKRNHRPAWCVYEYKQLSNDSSLFKDLIQEMSLEKQSQLGKLYNWYAVKDRRGLAPEGWHIPSKAEVRELIIHLAGRDAGDYSALASIYLKDSLCWGYSHIYYSECSNCSRWIKKYRRKNSCQFCNNSRKILTIDSSWSNNNGSNSSGFSALPYVSRSGDGKFIDKDVNSGGWWTSTKSRISSRRFFKMHGAVYYNFDLSYPYFRIIKSPISQSYGFSIRCIKDK